MIASFLARILPLAEPQEFRLRELGQRVRDEEPWARTLDEDVLVRTPNWIVIEKPRRYLEPSCVGWGIGHQ